MATSSIPTRRPGGKAPEPISPPKKGYAAQYEWLLIEEKALRDSQNRFLDEMKESTAPNAPAPPPDAAADADCTTNDERRMRQRPCTSDLKIRAMVHRANLGGMLLTAQHAAIEASSVSASTSRPPNGYERGLERPDAKCALAALWDVKSLQLEDLDNRIPLIIDDDSLERSRKRRRLVDPKNIDDGAGDVVGRSTIGQRGAGMIEACVDDFFISFPECRRRDDALLYGDVHDDESDDDDDESDDESRKTNKAREKQQARVAGLCRSKKCESIVEVTCSSSSSPSPERPGKMKSAVGSNDGGMRGDNGNNGPSSADDMRNRERSPPDYTPEESRNRSDRDPQGSFANEPNNTAVAQSQHCQSGRPSSIYHPDNPHNADMSDQYENRGSNYPRNSLGNNKMISRSQQQRAQSRRPSSNDNPENPYQMQPRGVLESNHSSQSHYQHSSHRRPPTNAHNIDNTHQKNTHGVQQPTRWQDDKQSHNSHQTRSPTFDYDDNNSYGRSEPPIKKNPFCTARELLPICNDNSRGDNQAEVGRGRGEREDDDWDNYGSNEGGANNRSTSSTGPCGPQHLVRAAIRGPKDNMSAGLKRKFQPPMKRDGGGGGIGNSCGQNSGNGGHKSYNSTNRHASSGGGGSGGGNVNNVDEELPEELRGLDKELIEKINNEIVDTGEQVTFDDIAGLKHAKQTVNELVIMPMIRPDLFTGLRACPKGLLLFGPPGTGKTLIGKAIAHESRATFFSISSSSLTSKWIGEGEKLVRTLFAVASYRAPSVVFIDEVDSMLTQRKADENEASRRIKTEFLVQLDGAGNGRKGQVLVIGATNRPQELDDAARRRFVKKLYIPLPDQDGREALIANLLKKNDHTLTDAQLAQLAKDSEGFSGADLKILCTEAAMGPLRKFGAKAVEMNSKDVPPISYKNFRQALRQVNPSVAQSDLASHIEWNNTYGSMVGPRSDDSSQDSDTEGDND
ncbi:hypothetical protein ACHAXA_008337 [Cyclostephanos tholiformis]|uniref:AAA+ ATPase domain-containing protein n=1 Tax=Cyclostephanos tholiformis TaxID=382380 RepID=A0ABD3R9U4_9STRA